MLKLLSPLCSHGSLSHTLSTPRRNSTPSHSGLRALLPYRKRPETTGSSALAPRAPVPWTTDTGIDTLASLSDQPVNRRLKRPASKRDLYAESLDASQRGVLEKTLEQRFCDPEYPHKQQALTLWQSLQQARLHIHRVQKSHTAICQSMAWPRWLRKDDYASSKRPEYATARANFARVINNESLDLQTRITVARHFGYHARREGTLSPSDAAALRGLEHAHPGEGITLPAGTPQAREVSAAFIWAAPVEEVVTAPTIHSLEEDLALQEAPLGTQIEAWLTAAWSPGLPDPNAFNEEPLSSTFARLLARQQLLSAPACDPTGGLLQQGARVIHGIARDPTLRRDVFQLAEDALGSCGDRVAEGFSNVVRHVLNHHQDQLIEQGDIDHPSLNLEARQQFRYYELEKAVTRLIPRMKNETTAALEALPAQDLDDEGLKQRQQLLDTQHLLQNEPLEMLLHAKVYLQDDFDLPQDLPQTMRYPNASAFKEPHLKELKNHFRNQVDNPANLKDFLAHHESWKKGMEKLHADKLAPLTAALHAHPLLTKLPPQGIEFAAEQQAYNQRVRALENKTNETKLALLYELAGLP